MDTAEPGFNDERLEGIQRVDFLAVANIVKVGVYAQVRRPELERARLIQSRDDPLGDAVGQLLELRIRQRCRCRQP